MKRTFRALGEMVGVTMPEEIEDWEPILEAFTQAIQGKRTIHDLIGVLFAVQLLDYEARDRTEHQWQTDRAFCRHVSLLVELDYEPSDTEREPLPVREATIPKKDGKVRRLGIPTLRVRVAQMALKLVLEPIFEGDFYPSSYGYRPAASPGCHRRDPSLHEQAVELRVGHPVRHQGLLRQRRPPLPDGPGRSASHRPEDAPPVMSPQYRRRYRRRMGRPNYRLVLVNGTRSDAEALRGQIGQLLAERLRMILCSLRWMPTSITSSRHCGRLATAD